MNNDEILRKEAESLNIMNFKLTNGDEIIALINRNKPNESVILLDTPLQMIKQYDRSSYTLFFQEWMPMALDSVVAVMRNNIISYSKCTSDSKEQYLNHLINLNSVGAMDQEYGDMDDIDIDVDITVVH